MSRSGSEVEGPIETLGGVTAPSGILLVIDTGYLNLWSHDCPPRMPEDVVGDEEVTARANAFVDVCIEGPDAIEAGKVFDRSWNLLYLFDVSPDSVAPNKTL